MNQGLEAFLSYPFFQTVMNRRSRRIMRGIQSIPAGTLTYTSEQKPRPLEPLEEAILISMLGMTGISMPDRPFQDADGQDILGTPNVRMGGRAAGSADNAQNTHFFMINDTGTYYLRHLDQPLQKPEFTEEALLAAAEACKVRVSDQRLEFPRRFPFYLDSNRFLSNLEGSTIFLPVVDQSIQYINGLMYLLTGPPGSRPMFVDDRNGFVPAGVEKWVKDGYLNREIPLTLSLIDTFRAHIESSLLLQNLMLCLQAMGLGGWIHASFEGPFLLGHPGPMIRAMAGESKGLDFKLVVPPARDSE